MHSFRQSDLLDRLPEQFFAKLASKAAKMVEAGYDVINLGQGNPDLATPDAIVKALQNAAEKPINHKYAPFRGFPELKDAVADFYQRTYDVTVDPEQEVAVLFGAKAGLIELCQCLLNPGEEALLPDPGYPDYLSGMAIANAEPVFFPLLREHGYLPDYQAIGDDVLDRAKLMILNYPNNPTAAKATRSFFDETVNIAKQHEICVVHDFAYGALQYDQDAPSFLQSQGAKDVGVEIYTLSKTYNMAGWRVAFAVGNPSVIEQLNLLQDHMYVSLFGAVQEAATEALTGEQSAVDLLRDTYQTRRDRFMAAVARIGWNADIPRGTFFAWLPVPDGFTSSSFSTFVLEKAHVVLAPGNGFGSHGEGYVRVGLLDTCERLEEAVERIGELNLF